MTLNSLAMNSDKPDRFWRTFGIVLAVHAVVIGGTVAISRWLFPRAVVEQITWLDGGLVVAPAMAEEPPVAEATPEPIVEAPVQPEPPKPVDNGELPLAPPTPTPAPTPTPTPVPRTPTPPPKTKPASTVKRTTPRPKEKTVKKTVVKATPKPQSTPAPTPALATQPKPTEGTASTAPNAAPQAGTKPGPGAANGTGTSAAVADAMKKYGNEIQPRFYAVWEQPVTGEDTSAGKLMGTISFRVAADGTVMWIKVFRPSGNRLVDASLEAVCRKIKSLPPPPSSICSGGTFQSRIEMVLDR